MRIDSSRYTMFWQNPERYRLREIWKLAPIEPAAGTFASILTYGRRRGTCLHELLDADYRQVKAAQAVQDLRAAGFENKEICAATLMYGAVKDRYKDEEILAHEQLFEFAIPDTPHSMVGRIDSVIRRDDEVLVADWKSTKKRTKKEHLQKAESYCRSFQVPFYLVGAKTLGFEPSRFLYRMVVDSDPVEITEHFTERTNTQLKEFCRQVAMTCDLIEWLKATFGVERPWPQIPEVFGNDYAAIAGHKMYPDYVPDGFQPKIEHLELMK